MRDLSEDSRITPDWNWDMLKLSGNPIITSEFVDNHTSWIWNMEHQNLSTHIPEKMVGTGIWLVKPRY